MSWDRKCLYVVLVIALMDQALLFTLLYEYDTFSSASQALSREHDCEAKLLRSYEVYCQRAQKKYF
jgi:hypothetical protein